MFGNAVKVGDRVSVPGVITAITSEQPTYCNITFLPDEAMEPGATPNGLALSARMVRPRDPFNAGLSEVEKPK